MVAFSGFLTASGAAAFGWTGYAPLSNATYSPGAGGNLWIMGLILSSTSGILGAVNFIATTFAMRAPGMTMFRMPIFVWNILVTSLLILLTFPVLTTALAMLFLDRTVGASFFDPAAGGSAILWQHLFWFFGHPEVECGGRSGPRHGPRSALVGAYHSRRLMMPAGSSKKRERQYEHIKEGYQERGVSKDEAEERAARTVNKERREAGETKDKKKS